MAEVEGFSVAAYGAMAAAVAPVFGGMVEDWSTAIQSENYAVTESALKINADATQRMLQTAQEAGINAEFPKFVADLFARGMQMGYGEEELATIIKVLRATA